MAFLSWGAQNWAQLGTCGLTNTEQRIIIIYLTLLVALLIIQPSMSVVFFTSGASCWLTFHLSSSSSSRTSANLLSSRSAPSLHLLHRLIPPQVQDSVFAFNSSLLDFFPVLGFFLFPVSHPDCKPQVKVVGIQDFQERDWSVNLSYFLNFAIKEFLVTT